jgi:hypothetical protein
MLLAVPAPSHHAVAPSTLLGPFTAQTVFALIAALLLWIVVYMLYRLVMTRRKDFGVPVRRRILCRRLRVHNDQVADVPFWWTDLQIQLAVRNHWRNSLRSPFGQDVTPQPQL